MGDGGWGLGAGGAGDGGWGLGAGGWGLSLPSCPLPLPCLCPCPHLLSPFITFITFLVFGEDFQKKTMGHDACDLGFGKG